MSISCNISSQTIINLAENGVPAKIFRSRIKSSVERTLASLSTFEGPQAMVHLRHTIASRSGIIIQRQARELLGQARARGFTAGYNRRPGQADLADDDPAAQDDVDTVRGQSCAWWGDPVSGLPSTLEETAVQFIDGGFTPQNCKIFREKLRAVGRTTLYRQIRPPKYQVHVPMSCHGVFVPGGSRLRTNPSVRSYANLQILLGYSKKARYTAELHSQCPCWMVLRSERRTSS